MNSEQPHDPLPLLVAQLDQALAMASEMARVMRGYYDAFKEQDFTEAQALWLAAAQVKDLGDPPDGTA